MTHSIVLIHAVRSSRTMWAGQVRRLRKKGFEVHAPDLPGHGTRRGEPFTVDAALATIDAAVDACTEPPLLVGLSLGGYLTLHWAGRSADRLAGVVAADCTIVPGPALARLYGLWMTMKDWLPGDSDSRVERSFARRHSRKAARRYYGGGRAHGVVAAVVRAIGGIDLLADVAAISVPIIFVNGEHDPFRRHEALFLEAARDGELVVLEGAGHIANLSRPKRFTKILRRCAAGAPLPV
ncbi:alpha/beta hydrolase [Brachybacterium sp. J144]|uniref:alpha/beta hydrolase n=1 Tax=Brachybacterium sp. J144 TaxID=3116487 RepID=UPI002E761339|nr:alpha/beta hydrolase [Brachybacterium sp. J144]MEE1649471.1 alpha/beta hydrolase [Brachybacterium sp. J144]